jgi:predicted Fe-Mo cluster-binding NifX family protein
MRFAISTDGANVSAHFGRCPEFTLVDIENGKIVHSETIDNPGHSPGLIPRFLNHKDVNCIICGGMGARATEFFMEYGIKIITGVEGKVEDTIERLVEGTLEGGPSFCAPGQGKGYGIEKTECSHPSQE